MWMEICALQLSQQAVGVTYHTGLAYDMILVEVLALLIFLA